MEKIFFFPVGLSPQQLLDVKAESGSTLPAESSLEGPQSRSFTLIDLLVPVVVWGCGGPPFSSVTILVSPGLSQAVPRGGLWFEEVYSITLLASSTSIL